MRIPDLHTSDAGVRISARLNLDTPPKLNSNISNLLGEGGRGEVGQCCCRASARRSYQFYACRRGPSMRTA